MPALPFALLAPVQARKPTSEAVDAAGFATFPLAAAPETPGRARSVTRSTLRGWGLDALVDDTAVVVSELVTNALRYGLPAKARDLPPPLPPATTQQPFLLSFVHCGGSVLCAVFDPGQEVPRVREPDFFEESGRGLHVLDSLAERWGWTTPDRHGKAVWALLAPQEACPEWEPLTKLLLLLELLSGPSWLKSLGASAAETSAAHQGDRRHA
ncbi:ATP-binding protein [Streptomyces sp. SBT349]|uniref:ATP-binding protein n=1 Tax=Streptomyces sp. SBT349 TaxID=1580539 RepID=UPI000A747FFD|nr:ATP-binding protein [Streptomyces sp. SBT349]